MRANVKMDPYALKAWCGQVLATANEDRSKPNYRRGTSTLDFLKEVARLSWSEDGQRIAGQARDSVRVRAASAEDNISTERHCGSAMDDRWSG